MRLLEPSPINECEPDYALLSSVAEFWCVATSIGLVLLMLALHSLVLPPHDIAPTARNVCAAGALAGVASAVYHATLLRWTLVADQVVQNSKSSYRRFPWRCFVC